MLELLIVVGVVAILIVAGGVYVWHRDHDGIPRETLEDRRRRRSA